MLDRPWRRLGLPTRSKPATSAFVLLHETSRAAKMLVNEQDFRRLVVDNVNDLSNTKRYRVILMTDWMDRIADEARLQGYGVRQTPKGTWVFSKGG